MCTYTHIYLCLCSFSCHIYAKFGIRIQWLSRVAGPSTAVWTLMLPVVCCSFEVYVGMRWWWWWWWWCLSSHCHPFMTCNNDDMYSQLFADYVLRMLFCARWIFYILWLLLFIFVQHCLHSSSLRASSAATW